MQPFQLFQLARAQTPIVLAPTIIRLFGNADLPNRINPGHSLPDQYFNLAQLGDNLFELVSLDSHHLLLRLLTIPVDQFSGGGSPALGINVTRECFDWGGKTAPPDLDLVTPIAPLNIRHSLAPCDTRVTTRGSRLARLFAHRARSLKWLKINGRGERIRTSGPCLPKTVTGSK